MESRVARLESDVKHIDNQITDIKLDIRELRKDVKGNFLFLLTTFAAGFLALAGMMAKGFHWF